MSLRQSVQYPVKYYSHLDAGAPQLADADGVIKTILKACLVTGYGAKEGAGWTALFDDAFRIVLRRPLGTGLPPDIKIENGIINGVASHRIISQDNPTGINDATEIATVNLLARDNRNGVGWHLIASDFGFLFCYQMAKNQNFSSSSPKYQMVYVGSISKIKDSDLDVFITSFNSSVNKDGTASGFLYYFTHPDTKIKNMRDGSISSKKVFLDFGLSAEKINEDYVAQPIYISTWGRVPFYCAASSTVDDFVSNQISIEGRPFLRFINNASVGSTNNHALYIPLDYWEL